ncbi:MAG TPA: hypothetical protein PK748_06840, partial [Acidimicrobiales bacterium]|nr:hypothetical protein [Acidimicrobiales bacterium]
MSDTPDPAPATDPGPDASPDGTTGPDVRPEASPEPNATTGGTAGLTGLGPGPTGLAARVPAPVLTFVRRPVVRGVAAGLLIALSLPPWGWWPLAFGGLALFDRLLAGASARQRLEIASMFRDHLA